MACHAYKHTTKVYSEKCKNFTTSAAEHQLSGGNRMRWFFFNIYKTFFTLNWITIFINFLLFLVFLRQSQRFSFCVSFLYILNYAQKKTTNHLFMNSIYLLLDSCYHIMWRRRLIGFSVHWFGCSYSGFTSMWPLIWHTTNCSLFAPNLHTQRVNSKCILLVI